MRRHEHVELAPAVLADLPGDGEHAPAGRSAGPLRRAEVDEDVARPAVLVGERDEEAVAEADVVRADPDMVRRGRHLTTPRSAVGGPGRHGAGGSWTDGRRTSSPSRRTPGATGSPGASGPPGSRARAARPAGGCGPRTSAARTRRGSGCSRP